MFGSPESVFTTKWAGERLSKNCLMIYGQCDLQQAGLYPDFIRLLAILGCASLNEWAWAPGHRSSKNAVAAALSLAAEMRGGLRKKLASSICITVPFQPQVKCHSPLLTPITQEVGDTQSPELKSRALSSIRLSSLQMPTTSGAPRPLALLTNWL